MAGTKSFMEWFRFLFPYSVTLAGLVVTTAVQLAILEQKVTDINKNVDMNVAHIREHISILRTDIHRLNDKVDARIAGESKRDHSERIAKFEVE